MQGRICAVEALPGGPAHGAHSARRERRVIKAGISYRGYLAKAHGPMWRRTRMSDLIAERVQDFIERDTGHAYDILIIETPPQHGKSMTVTETLPS